MLRLALQMSELSTEQFSRSVTLPQAMPQLRRLSLQMLHPSAGHFLQPTADM
jgi:hypothetical protein